MGDEDLQDWYDNGVTGTYEDSLTSAPDDEDE